MSFLKNILTAPFDAMQTVSRGSTTAEDVQARRQAEAEEREGQWRLREKQEQNQAELQKTKLVHQAKQNAEELQLQQQREKEQFKADESKRERDAATAKQKMELEAAERQMKEQTEREQAKRKHEAAELDKAARIHQRKQEDWRAAAAQANEEGVEEREAHRKALSADEKRLKAENERRLNEVLVQEAATHQRQREEEQATRERLRQHEERMLGETARQKNEIQEGEKCIRYLRGGNEELLTQAMFVDKKSTAYAMLSSAMRTLNTRANSVEDELRYALTELAAAKSGGDSTHALNCLDDVRDALRDLRDEACNMKSCPDYTSEEDRTSVMEAMEQVQKLIAALLDCLEGLKEAPQSAQALAETRKAFDLLCTCIRALRTPRVPTLTDLLAEWSIGYPDGNTQQLTIAAGRISEPASSGTQASKANAASMKASVFAQKKSPGVSAETTQVGGINKKAEQTRIAATRPATVPTHSGAAGVIQSDDYYREQEAGLRDAQLANRRQREQHDAETRALREEQKKRAQQLDEKLLETVRQGGQVLQKLGEKAYEAEVANHAQMMNTVREHGANVREQLGTQRALAQHAFATRIALLVADGQNADGRRLLVAQEVLKATAEAVDVLAIAADGQLREETPDKKRITHVMDQLKTKVSELRRNRTNLDNEVSRARSVPVETRREMQASLREPGERISSFSSSLMRICAAGAPSKEAIDGFDQARVSLRTAMEEITGFLDTNAVEETVGRAQEGLDRVAGQTKIIQQ